MEDIVKKGLIIALLIITTSFAFGQESKTYLKFKKKSDYEVGYILSADSVKVKGLIKVPLINKAKKYSVVTFVYTNGTKKNFYPNEIKGFGYFMYKFVSGKSSFYKVAHAGTKVSVYTRLSVNSHSIPGPGGNSMMSSSYSSEEYYVKRANEISFKLVRKRKFKEEFSKYFEDCKGVVESILNEKLTHKDIKTIVRKYNYCQ